MYSQRFICEVEAIYFVLVYINYCNYQSNGWWYYVIQNGERAIYRCRSGYKLQAQGNRDRRIILNCIANETHAMFDGPQPVCERE